MRAPPLRTLRPSRCTPSEVWSLRATRAAPSSRPYLQRGRCNHGVTILAPPPRKRPPSPLRQRLALRGTYTKMPCTLALMWALAPPQPLLPTSRRGHRPSSHSILHRISGTLKALARVSVPARSRLPPASLCRRLSAKRGAKACTAVRLPSRCASIRGTTPWGRPPRGTARSGPASESLTDEGEEERDSDGSVRDVRDKKRRYAKTFRDTEKHLFEKLRHRLFPQDPHAKRSECLERAIESVDELLQLRESEAQRQKEMHYLKQQLSDAERRIERLCRELNGRSHPMGN
ncbi:hypothetical protein H4582DRAFT_407926 [Lactarius indigo]|nr:hypothetical protein H4582DRAFT_407926 [Lactarius indigo]